MELIDVLRSTPNSVGINSPIVISFKIIGAETPFQFPFKNASLIDKKLIFVKKKEG